LDLREQAQYVELLKNCGGWRTPKAVSKSEVYYFLQNVGNSYGTLIGFGVFKHHAVQAVAKTLGLDESLTNTTGNWPADAG
jgi:hypothetical protein